LDMFKYYRISSNAVYPFKHNGNAKLLRFAPISEKDKSNILGELEFINYLNKNNYPALKIVLSSNSEALVTVRTPWGEYYACTFDRVTGMQLTDTDLRDNIMFEFGKTLGKLHKLSSGFTPTNKRWSHTDVLLWIKGTLEEFKDQNMALAEVNLLQDYFSKLPKSSENYGLVHYDFELDNVFYDEASNVCNVIDFDDAMYHWFAMDIAQTMDSIKDEIEPQKFEYAKEYFLNGYQSEYVITDETLSSLHVFSRFANLYSYTRILRSISEKWCNEPEWLINLRTKLENALNEKAKNFCTII
jgi:Ser/Thr protein kinase RdoA (MazF antagonist)